MKLLKRKMREREKGGDGHCVKCYEAIKQGRSSQHHSLTRCREGIRVRVRKGPGDPWG